MKLGAFSVSLTVTNLENSKSFYESLWFESFGGDISQNYLILKNGDTIIGLFKGMFEENILTFNPGWDQNCNNLEKFEDIEGIKKELTKNNISYNCEKMGPGTKYITLKDPDGNSILIDQHI